MANFFKVLDPTWWSTVFSVMTSTWWSTAYLIFYGSLMIAGLVGFICLVINECGSSGSSTTNTTSTQLNYNLFIFGEQVLKIVEEYSRRLK